MSARNPYEKQCEVKSDYVGRGELARPMRDAFLAQIEELTEDEQEIILEKACVIKALRSRMAASA